jgi:hypothetical protein
LTLDLSINGQRANVATIADLRHALASFTQERVREVWITVQDGPALCALFSGGNGWLMYLRKNGDAGFSSRNPDYRGEMDAMLEYQLSNGQSDVYPASWALPKILVIEALEHFVEYRDRPPFVQWQDDGA